jgi:drug/metabolite transporter (DMT)-like permease
MRTLVYYSLCILLGGVVFKYIDGPLEKTTMGTGLAFLLDGLLLAVVFTYLEKRDAPMLAWLMSIAVGCVLMILLYHVLTRLGLPVE